MSDSTSTEQPQEVKVDAAAPAESAAPETASPTKRSAEDEPAEATEAKK